MEAALRALLAGRRALPRTFFRASCHSQRLFTSLSCSTDAGHRGARQAALQHAVARTPLQHAVARQALQTVGNRIRAVSCSSSSSIHFSSSQQNDHNQYRIKDSKSSQNNDTEVRLKLDGLESKQAATINSNEVKDPASSPAHDKVFDITACPSKPIDESVVSQSKPTTSVASDITGATSRDGDTSRDVDASRDGATSRDGDTPRDGDTSRDGSTSRVSDTSRDVDSSKVGDTSRAMDTKAKDDGGKTLSSEPRPTGVVGYLLSRYTWYIERLQRRLETGMPKTFRMFRVFGVGLKAFVSDFTELVRVLVSLSQPWVRLETLQRRQLELYHTMPGDMLKVFPVLLISAIPFGQNVALPLGYFFPRQLLCRHFWDLQQTHEFSMRALGARVRHAKRVFRCVQATVDGIQAEGDRARAQAVCHQLGSGIHPSKEEVLELRSLFAGKPYSIDTIYRAHVGGLLRLHGLPRGPFGRWRLRHHARWLRCHDHCLVRDGLPTLHVTALKNSLLLRGISPIGLDSSGMLEVLGRWLAVSMQLGQQDASLLLHLPVLLFYNHPTNLSLVSK